MLLGLLIFAGALAGLASSAQYPGEQDKSGDPWTITQPNGFSYLIVNTAMDWFDARAYCNQRKARLITDQIHKFISFGNFKNHHEFWTGLHKLSGQNSYSWVDTTLFEPQLSDSTSAGTCGLAKLVRNNGRVIGFARSFDKDDCQKTYKFICERIQDSCRDSDWGHEFTARRGVGKHSNSLYLRSSINVPYDYANLICSINNAALLSINDQTEQDFIERFITTWSHNADITESWMDGSLSANGYCWNSGFKFEFHSIVGVPSFGQLYVTSSGDWKTVDKNSLKGFICVTRCSQVPASGSCMDKNAITTLATVTTVSTTKSNVTKQTTTGFDFKLPFCNSTNIATLRITLNDPKLICCDGFAINTDSYACCNGNVQAKTGRHHHTKCCGKTLYNPRVSICCNSVERPLFDMGNRLTTSCCDTLSYDVHHFKCCQNVLYKDKLNTKGCCGSKIVKYRQLQCCSKDELDSDCLKRRGYTFL